MTEAPRKRRKPILLITVASLAAATILYLEFFADPIIDPPEFYSDGAIQIQYLTARSPFSRREVLRLVTVDCLRSPARYEFRGRDVFLGSFHPEVSESVLSEDCVLLSDPQVRVGLRETFELLWSQRGYVRHLREYSSREGSLAHNALNPFLRHVAEELGDLHLARLTWLPAHIGVSRGGD